MVRRDGGSLLVTIDTPSSRQGQSNRRRLIEVEPHRVEMIVLVGHVHLTSDASMMCLQLGIAVAWMSRAGRMMGRLEPRMSATADIRGAQYATATNGDHATYLARRLIRANR